MSDKLGISVTGQIAQYPLGDVTWFYLQYVRGFDQLGHDVWYVEDSGKWPHNPVADGLVEGCDYNVAYLEGVMNRYGLAGKWVTGFRGCPAGSGSTKTSVGNCRSLPTCWSTYPGRWNDRPNTGGSRAEWKIHGDIS